MEIDFKNYLSEDEVKEIVTDELRLQVRKLFQDEDDSLRLLSNLSYKIVQEEVEKIVPNHTKMIVDKVAEIIQEKNLTYHIFNDGYSGKSLGQKILDSAIQNNAETLKNRVRDCIQNRDYSEEAWRHFETLGDNFMSNIYDFVESIKPKKAE